MAARRPLSRAQARRAADKEPKGLDHLPRAKKIWQQVYSAGIRQFGATPARAARIAWDAVEAEGFARGPSGSWGRVEVGPEGLDHLPQAKRRWHDAYGSLRAVYAPEKAASLAYETLGRLGYEKVEGAWRSEPRRAAGKKAPGKKRKEKTMNQHRSSCSAYKLTVVDNDKNSAQQIRHLIEQGIERAADLCQVNPPVCRGNLGLARDQMPQILDKSPAALLKDNDPDRQALGRAILDAGGQRGVVPIKAWLSHLRRSGVKIQTRKIPVGMLKATQREIQARKAVSMADSHLCGNFPNIDAAVLGSADGHILDGHHRWAALAMIDPAREMEVQVVDLPIRELLHEAAAYPGIFQADFMGRPLGRDAQQSYKAAHRSKLSPKRRPAKRKTASKETKMSARAVLRALGG